MIEAIPDMPPRTIGLRVWAEVTREDYVDVLIPAVKQAVDDYGEIRLIFQAGPDFGSFSSGMIGADVTSGLGFGVKHWTAWKRMAIVTDVEWLRRSMQVFGWMTPGEARLFALKELHWAKEWVAG
jgi:stage II sporulation SpoAA-like protein